jgi:FKBP-type peptidyl-prolyl cis-trans isomerase SlyD
MAILVFNPAVSSAAAAKIGPEKEVTLAYKLFVEGTLLETADEKNPFTYVHGQKQIVPGLEKGLAGLQVGDQKTIRVLPKEAYGLVDPKALQEIEKENLPPDVSKEKGTLVEARNPEGMTMLVKIVEVKEKTVVIDFNHPLAGKELEFQIEVLGIK